MKAASAQLSHSVMSNSLRPHGLQHGRLLSITNSAAHGAEKLINLFWVLVFSYVSFWFVVESVSPVRFSATPRTAAHQASPSFTISWSLLRFVSVESVMLSNHLILCHALLRLPSIFPSIRVFYSESALHIRWTKY